MVKMGSVSKTTSEETIDVLFGVCYKTILWAVKNWKHAKVKYKVDIARSNSKKLYSNQMHIFFNPSKKLWWKSKNLKFNSAYLVHIDYYDDSVD